MDNKTTKQNINLGNSLKSGLETGKTVKTGKELLTAALNETKEAKQIILNKKARRTKIATRLKEIRTSHKLTQKNICDKLNLNQLTYSNYEKERNDVPVEILIQLADMYDISMDYITCRTDNPKGMYIDSITPNETEENNDMEARIAKLEEAIEKLKSI